MRPGRFIILFVFTLILSNTFAQQNLNYFFRHINQSDGLLHNQVVSIVQDGRGFIWVATPNGLQRYDGSRFIYYPEILSDAAQQLTHGADLYTDNKNNLLWIIKNNIIEKMLLGKNRFTIYNAEQLLKDSSFYFNTYKPFNNNSYSWILGSNTVYLHDNATKKSIRQGNIIFPGVGKTSYIFKDSVNRHTWVAVMSKLFLFNEKTKLVYSCDSNPMQHPLLDSSLYGTGEHASRFVMVDSRNNTWVTTWGDRLYRYDPLTKNISTYFLSAIKSIQLGRKVPAAGLLINCMLEDDHNNIWVATENAGLLRYNREKDNFDYAIVEEKNSKRIQYNYNIYSLFQDKEENIWIGTDKGVNIFNPYRQYFKTLRHEENNPLSISKNEIQSFIQINNGDIFIGTWGAGIAVYDSSFHFKKNILFKDPEENNFVWSLLQPDDKTIWIGCQRGYLRLYNIADGSIQSLHPPEMEGSTIRCMQKDNNGNIWLGLHNGKIIKWDKQQQTFLPFGDSLKTRAPVLNIFIDQANHFWISTELGFKEFDPAKRIYITTWLPDKNNATGIFGKTCQGIEAYNDSILIIGTIYGGLNFFNKRTGTFSHFNTVDGLPSNSIYAIKKDVSGYIWFTTDYGLYKFNPVEKKIIPYMEPGVINAAFTSNKFYPLQDGQWLTFTSTEAISFYPGKAEYQDNRQLKIEITGFKLFDKPVFIDSLLSEHKPISFSYKENFFTIEFAALNFSSLQQTNYYYRLEGIDKDWVNGGTKRFANYTDLQPGEYSFDVKAENGNSSGKVTSFKIMITPPVWQTTWFRLIIILLVVVLTYLLFRRRINTIRHEAELKHRIAETEMMALRAQMNPHFIFNCINSIDALIQSNDKYQATVYLNKFAKLIRNILDSSKQNVVTLSKDIETLQLYIDLEKFRNENTFTVEIDADKNLLQDDYKVPPLIIQPYVENAILHGLRNRMDNNGKLLISVQREDGQIKFTIEDNGVGRQTTANGKQDGKRSYGMQMSNDRIKLFNKENTASVLITDLEKDGKTAGTKVEVFLNI